MGQYLLKHTKSVAFGVCLISKIPSGRTEIVKTRVEIAV